MEQWLEQNWLKSICVLSSLRLIISCPVSQLLVTTYYFFDLLLSAKTDSPNPPNWFFHTGFISPIHLRIFVCICAIYALKYLSISIITHTKYFIALVSHRYTCLRAGIGCLLADLPLLLFGVWCGPYQLPYTMKIHFHFYTCPFKFTIFYPFYQLQQAIEIERCSTIAFNVNARCWGGQVLNTVQHFVWQFLIFLRHGKDFVTFTHLGKRSILICVGLYLWMNQIQVRFNLHRLGP